MEDGRSRREWARTSAQLALLANVHRDPKRRAFKPADFDPYARRGEASSRIVDTKTAFGAMRAAFVGKRKNRRDNHAADHS
jgi:hypothetical protein